MGEVRGRYAATLLCPLRCAFWWVELGGVSNFFFGAFFWGGVLFGYFHYALCSRFEAIWTGLVTNYLTPLLIYVVVMVTYSLFVHLVSRVFYFHVHGVGSYYCAAGAVFRVYAGRSTSGV